MYSCVLETKIKTKFEDGMNHKYEAKKNIFCDDQLAHFKLVSHIHGVCDCCESTGKNF